GRPDGWLDSGARPAPVGPVRAGLTASHSACGLARLPLQRVHHAAPSSARPVRHRQVARSAAPCCAPPRHSALATPPPLLAMPYALPLYPPFVPVWLAALLSGPVTQGAPGSDLHSV